MDFIYKRMCCFNRHKIIVEELNELFEMNHCITDKELLNYLYPHKDTHPVAGTYYKTISNHLSGTIPGTIPCIKPSHIIESQQAYEWLLTFHQNNQ
mgnify:CR=1 FL=1